MTDRVASSDVADRKGFDRNFWLNIAESAFINAGFTCFSVSYYLAMWLTELGAGPMWIGMLSTMWFVGIAVTQPYSAARVRPLSRIKPYLLTWFGWQRAAILALIVGILVIGPRRPQLLMALTFVSIVTFTLTEGMAHPVWFQWIGKTTPQHQRGQLFGLRSSVGGFAGMGANLLAAICLAFWSYPKSYLLLFSMGFVVLMGSWTCYWFMKEVPHTPAPPPPPGESVWINVWRTVVSEPSTTRFLLAVLVVQLAILLPANFFVAYAIQGKFIQPALAATVATVGSVAIMMWSPLLGWIGDRIGNRWLLVVSGFFGACAAFCGWCTPWGVGWQYGASVFCGGAGISASIGVGNLILEYAPKGEEAHYTSVTVPIVGVAGMVSPFLGGLLAEWAGFPVLMASSIFLCALAAVGVWLLILSRSKITSPA